MRAAAVPRREAFTGYNERRSVGTEVEEELREDVECEEGFSRERVVGEADCDEDAGEQDKAHELDGFAAEGVDGGDGYPVAGDGACACDDEVADSLVKEDFVDVGAFGVTDFGQDDGVVEAET